MNLKRLHFVPACIGATLALSLLSHPAIAQTIDKIPPPAGSAAVVNGVAISDQRLQQAVQQATQNGTPDTPQLRAALKSQLVALEVIRQQALKNATVYEKRPDTRKAIQEAKDSVITQAYLKDAIKPAPVTDDMVRAQFNTIIDSLGQNEYKARLIQVGDEEAAKNILAQLKAGKDFAALAGQASLAPNKARGGELEWVSFKLPVQEGKTQNLPLPIAQAITQLTPGAVTPAPVVVNGAFYVIRLDQMRPTQVPQYDSVKAPLRQTLERQALEKATIAFIGDLMKTAKIQQ
jgi:peptidyl-prolyl cis-trans isomerase C